MNERESKVIGQMMKNQRSIQKTHRNRDLKLNACTEQIFHKNSLQNNAPGFAHLPLVTEISSIAISP